MSKQANLLEVTIDNTSNLTLKTRRGTYARNETDPQLRAKIVDNVWPKSKRSRSVRNEQLPSAANSKETYRSPIRSGSENRSQSLSPVRSVSSEPKRREASAPNQTERV